MNILKACRRLLAAIYLPQRPDKPGVAAALQYQAKLRQQLLSNRDEKADTLEDESSRIDW